MPYKDKIKKAEHGKKWRQDHKEKHLAQKKIYHYRHKYGLSLPEIDELIAAQNNECLICGKTLIKMRRCVDHNHKTGKVRGILCKRCNTGLTYIEDKEFAIRAAQYLERTL